MRKQPVVAPMGSQQHPRFVHGSRCCLPYTKTHLHKFLFHAPGKLLRAGKAHQVNDGALGGLDVSADSVGSLESSLRGANSECRGGLAFAFELTLI